MKIFLKITIVFLLILAAIIFIYKSTLAYNKTEPYSYNGKGRNIECLYYNSKDFINIPEYFNKNVDVRGCILAHHLVAKDLIHEVFQNLNKDKYKTIVLIGPDHESIHKGKIFTTLKDWQTPFGILKTNTEITKKLLKGNKNIIIENDEKLTIEHSTSSIVPFISYYLENVNVITLVLTKQVDLSNLDILIDVLFQNLNIDETLFIASVDFSHYLSLEEAKKMDSISIEAIENNNINKIMSFTNDNLDSPISIIAMLKIMDKANINTKILLNHSNSEIILRKNLEETTSYVTFLFY